MLKLLDISMMLNRIDRFRMLSRLNVYLSIG